MMDASEEAKAVLDGTTRSHVAAAAVLAREVLAQREREEELLARVIRLRDHMHWWRRRALVLSAVVKRIDPARGFSRW